jgi:hypothetical protein
LAQHKTRVIGIAFVMTVCLAIGGASMVPQVRAQGETMDILQTLQGQSGKRVKVKLASGQDLEGQVEKVGANAVVLSQLSGMEFYDATVRLDQVAAVIVRRAK